MPDRNDPASPDYAPQYNGETDDGDVGSGDQFGADLYAIYAAGRLHLPAAAATYSAASATIHDVSPYLDRIIGSGGVYQLEDLAPVVEALQVAFVKSSEHLDAAGQALVSIADDYVRTDEDAAGSFELWLTQLAPQGERNDLEDPTPPVPDPTRPGDPHDDLGDYPHPPLIDGEES